MLTKIFLKFSLTHISFSWNLNLCALKRVKDSAETIDCEEKERNIRLLNRLLSERRILLQKWL